MIFYLSIFSISDCLPKGSGYGAFPGQTFIPNGGRGGGRGGGGYGGGDYYGGGGGGGGPPQPGGPAINPATGQPDYSAQWAEYYRSLGMGKEAEMIEQQMVSSDWLIVCLL